MAIINSKGLNQLKIGVLISYLQISLGVIISLIYTPALLRLLGQSEYGLFNLVTSIVGYLSILSLGFGGSYVRFYSKYKVKSEFEKIHKLNGIYLIFFTTISILSIIIGIILYINSKSVFGENLTDLEYEKAKILLLILTFNIALSFPNVIFKNYILANEKFIFQGTLNLIITILNPCVFITILLLGYKSIAMSIGVISVTFLVNIIHAIYCLKILNMKFSFKNLEFGLFKEIFIFSSFIFLSIITVNINWNVDKYILGRFWGTVAVAVYAVGSLLNFHYLNLSKTISNVFIPRVNRLVALDENNPELTNLFIKIGRIQFIVIFFIFISFFTFGSYFVSFWAGEDYEDSYIIALLLMSSVIVPSIQTIGIEIQKAKNIHRFRSIIYFLIALANLSITIPLAQKYGGIGAAIGTVIAQILGECIIMNIFYHKKVKIDIIAFWKEIFHFGPSLILPVILSLILKYYFTINSILSFIALVLLFSTIYFISFWNFGLNKFEKILIANPIMKYIFKRNKFNS